MSTGIVLRGSERSGGLMSRSLHSIDHGGSRVALVVELLDPSLLRKDILGDGAVTLVTGVTPTTLLVQQVLSQD